LRAFERLHRSYVHERRTDVLSGHFAALVPPDATVLDVGAGDGLIARKLLDRRPDLQVRAVEVLVRPETHVPVERFDGEHLDFSEGNFDAVLLADVLHHAADPEALLAEAARVTRGVVVVKDAMTVGIGAAATLQLMERLANTQHGIAMPERFWSPGEWQAAFERLGLVVDEWRTRLGLYPFPANLVFERSFHFVGRLRPAG
jgi:SAM-dependent methyltransferase